MNKAVIKDCQVEDTVIQGYRDIGGIIGYSGNESLVSNCNISNLKISVDKTNNYKNYSSNNEYDAGNFVGENHGSIENCSGEANITY